MSPDETLFDHLFGDLEGYLVTFTGKQQGANNLTDIRQQSYAYPSRREEAAGKLIAAGVAGRDAYFGVHLFREAGNRRSENAATLVRALWLDEDDGSFPDEGPPPTAVVHSSTHRRHLYWRLSHPVEAPQAVSLNRSIAAWAGGDRGKAALTSVLRAPGTFNYKRGASGEPVTLEITGVQAWEPEVLETALPALADPYTERPKHSPYPAGEFDLLGFLQRAGIEVERESPSPYGRIFEVECPWEHEHSCSGSRDTVVGVLTGGGAWFKCFHDGQSNCGERGWREFREAVVPAKPAGSIYARRRREVSI